VLPLHIDWSGDPRRYDLDDPQQRARVYEQVLREGNDDDIRFFIDVDQLQALWTRVWLPRRVRTARPEWFRRHRDVSLPRWHRSPGGSPSRREVAEGRGLRAGGAKHTGRPPRLRMHPRGSASGHTRPVADTAGDHGRTAPPTPLLRGAPPLH
jgi:hypothetical protein